MARAAAQPLVQNEASRNDESEESLWTQFTQQRLKAVQLSLSPTICIGLYILGGMAFIAVGTMLLHMSWGVAEYTMPYTGVKTDENGVGTVDLEITQDMHPPIWLYYELESFHQNHRDYVKSRDDSQLRAAKPTKIQASQLSACDPAITSDDGRPLYPCGLVARSVFNDTFAVVAKGSDGDSWKQLKVNSDANTIAWAADVHGGNFENYDPEEKIDGKETQQLLDMWIIERFPPVSCTQKDLSDAKTFKPAYVKTKVKDGVKVADCKNHGKDDASCDFVDIKGSPVTCEESAPIADWGVKSGHFIVWARVAGLPTFRKLWGKVDEKLLAGSKLKLYVADNFPVAGFGGKKSFILSTSSPFGGRNDFLGAGYIAVGLCCLVFGTWFIYQGQLGAA